MRAADCKTLAESPEGVFRQAHRVSLLTRFIGLMQRYTWFQNGKPHRPLQTAGPIRDG